MAKPAIIGAALLLLAGIAPVEAGPIVSFAGHEWNVRDYGGGPGPNEWSADNVYVDEAGLHLKITQVDGVWRCAEVTMLDTLGFGTYQFEIDGRPDRLDKNVVLGLFNYPASPEIGPDGSNEIDIEFAQWGIAEQQNRLNWSVYPPALGPKPTHRDVPLSLTGSQSTYRFEWSADGVRYGAYSGYGAIDEAHRLAGWNNAPAKPATRIPQVPLAIHINLWLSNGAAPSDGQPVELVIHGFSFTPA